MTNSSLKKSEAVKSCTKIACNGTRSNDSRQGVFPILLEHAPSAATVRKRKPVRKSRFHIRLGLTAVKKRCSGTLRAHSV